MPILSILSPFHSAKDRPLLPVFKAVAAGSSPPPPSAPVANFTGTPLSGNGVLSVHFTDRSTGTPTSWAWLKDDGSGNVSFANDAIANPVELFGVGNYSIDLTATNGSGSGEKTRVNYVIVGGPAGPGITINAVSWHLPPDDTIDTLDFTVSAVPTSGNYTVQITVIGGVLYTPIGPFSAQTVNGAVTIPASAITTDNLAFQATGTNPDGTLTTTHPGANTTIQFPGKPTVGTAVASSQQSPDPVAACIPFASDAPSVDIYGSFEGGGLTLLESNFIGPSPYLGSGTANPLTSGNWTFTVAGNGPLIGPYSDPSNSISLPAPLPVAVAVLSGLGLFVLTCDGTGSTGLDGTTDAGLAFLWVSDAGTIADATAATTTITFAITDTGTYNVSLTVTDVFGSTSSDPHTVTVLAGVIQTII